MSTPHYQDESVTLWHGDCLAILPTLAENSIDAIVTDPPYELAFMGKGWDSTGVGHGVELWAEALRVLRPGGHLLAFGGTRTSHRLAVAIEDAGFEIRDSIAWLYGSGFPKSLDVSKAIDKARDDNPDRKCVGAWLREQREAAGLLQKDVAKHWPSATGGLTGCVANWEGGFNCPTWEQWLKLRELIGFGDDKDAEVWRLNGRKGTPGEAWGEREVVGERLTGIATGNGAIALIGDNLANRTITAPATDDARTWQGWGTALKPAWESVVVATKPIAALDRIGSRLDELEQAWERSANAAASSSAPTPHDSPEGKIATAPASAATPLAGDPVKPTATGTADDSSAATATSASESTGATLWNTVTSWKACWAELSEATSTSTTSTTSSMTIDLETLWSCLSKITPASITTGLMNHDGPSSLVPVVDAMFAAAILNLRATRTLTAIESATSETPPTFQVAAGNHLEPIVVARKPLGANTVAANVLQHGTGALNIDATRVSYYDEADAAHPGGPRQHPTFGTKAEGAGTYNYRAGEGRNGATHDVSRGRWPANVVLDEHAAAALDEDSGALHTQNPATRNLRRNVGWSPAGTERAVVDKAECNVGGDGEAGTGASRFFPVFKYQAKAPASERPHVDGVAHATVKPLALMRWLVRLVTPPGGTVLDPFAGSGTTVEACILEGFHCVAIEREATYLPLIQHRIGRATAVLDAQEPTLFDGESA